MMEDPACLDQWANERFVELNDMLDARAVRGNELVNGGSNSDEHRVA